MLFRSSIASVIFISTLVFFCLIGARIPFLDQVLIGEEGSHALLIMGYNSNTSNLILDETTTKIAHLIDANCLLVIAHINGVDTVVRPSRNIVPYCFLGTIGKTSFQLLSPKNLSFNNKSFAARAIFLGISSLGMIALLIMCSLVSLKVDGYFRLMPFLIFIYASCNPLAVGASIQPQIDGVFGFLLLGLACLFLYFGSLTSLSTTKKLIFGFFVGFISALAKNEWPLALIFGILFLVIVLYLMRMFKVFFLQNNLLNKNLEFFTAVSIITGALSGIFFCYLISPSDYLAGYSLMKGINSGNTSYFKNFINAIRFNFELLSPFIVIWVAGLILLIKNLKKLIQSNFNYVIMWVWGSLIGMGYLLGGWGGDGFPRYYLPPLILCSAFLICQLTIGRYSSRTKSYALIFVLILVLISVYKLTRIYLKDESITIPGNSVAIQDEIIGAAKVVNRDPFGIVFHHSSLRFYFPDTNFISQAIGKEGAEQWKLPNSQYHLVF